MGIQTLAASLTAIAVPDHPDRRRVGFVGCTLGRKQRQFTDGAQARTGPVPAERSINQLGSGKKQTRSSRGSSAKEVAP